MRLYLLFAIGVLCLQFPAMAQNTLHNRLTGVWLNAHYVETLQKTRSPLAAINSVPADQASALVVDGDKAFQMNFIYGMHDGVPRNIAVADTITYNTYRITDLDIDEPERSKYKEYVFISGKDSVQWMDSTGRTVRTTTFIRIATEAADYDQQIRRCVAAYTLNGEYTVDEEYASSLQATGPYKPGYTFDTTGAAIWENRAFRFAVGIDFTFANCDYFFEVGAENNGNPVMHGYKWIEGKLHLFHAQDDEDEMLFCKTPPFLVLQPKSQRKE